MSTLERERKYIEKWRPKAVRGDVVAMSNLAAAYRILENFRLSAHWYRKASELGDGEAQMEWGYCLQHGIGVQKDEKAAEQAYRCAIGSECVTDYSREEAMYHLAVLLLGRRSPSSRRAASQLLREANVDGDYPQAEALSRNIELRDIKEICICRRHLRPRLARRHCPLHGPHRDLQGGVAKGSHPILRPLPRKPHSAL